MCPVSDMEFHITFDHRSSRQVLDSFMYLGWQILKNINYESHSNADKVRVFINNKEVITTNYQGIVDRKTFKKNFKDIMLNIKKYPFQLVDRADKLEGPGAIKGGLDKWGDEIDWELSRRFKNLIVLSSDITYNENIEGMGRLKNKHLIMRSMVQGAYSTADGSGHDTRIYLTNDQTYRNKAWKSLKHEKQTFFNHSDPELLTIHKDFTTSELEAHLAGAEGILCPKEPNGWPEDPRPNPIVCTCSEEPKCWDCPSGQKEILDIAVVLDGSIPSDYSGLIYKFLDNIGSSVANFGRSGTRIAVYTAAAMVLEPRADGQFKPWVQGQQQFDKMLRKYKNCTEWERRGCNKVFYETSGSFNFAQSSDLEDFHVNCQALTDNWGKYSAEIQVPSVNASKYIEGSFELVDIDTSVKEVMEHGFKCTRGARPWPVVGRRLFVLTWDYTTLQSKTLELAKLQDLNPQLYFLNPRNTKLIDCNDESFCHYDGQSFKEKFGKIGNLKVNDYSNIQHYESLTTDIKASEINYFEPMHDISEMTNDKIADIDSPFDNSELEESLMVSTKQVETCSMPLDAVLLLDGTTSVEELGWLKQLNFIYEIIGLMDIGTDKETQTRVAIMQFSEDGKVETHINHLAIPVDETILHEEVKGLANKYHRGKTTYLASALPKVRETFETSERKGEAIPRVLIVFSDGNVDDEEQIKQARMKLRGAEGDAGERIEEIFAIGVGTNYNEHVLKGELATDIAEEDMDTTGVINVRRPEQLRLKLTEFLLNMCKKRDEYSQKSKSKIQHKDWLDYYRNQQVDYDYPEPDESTMIQVKNSFCEWDTKSIFMARDSPDMWDHPHPGPEEDDHLLIDSCWCKEGQECFREPCKCDECGLHVRTQFGR